jgi:hypothetical protein
MLESISTSQQYFNETQIIVYDLGLSYANRQVLHSVCNVVLRTFEFSLYPHYIRNLIEYRWKPIVVAVRKVHNNVIVIAKISGSTK